MKQNPNKGASLNRYFASQKPAQATKTDDEVVAERSHRYFGLGQKPDTDDEDVA
jgi:hypothetical protein